MGWKQLNTQSSVLNHLNPNPNQNPPASAAKELATIGTNLCHVIQTHHYFIFLITCYLVHWLVVLDFWWQWKLDYIIVDSTHILPTTHTHILGGRDRIWGCGYTWTVRCPFRIFLKAVKLHICIWAFASLAPPVYERLLKGSRSVFPLCRQVCIMLTWCTSKHHVEAVELSHPSVDGEAFNQEYNL